MTDLGKIIQSIKPTAEPSSASVQEMANGNVIIRKNLVSVGGTIHQISNISAMSILDISRIKPVPWYLWILLIFTIASYTIHLAIFFLLAALFVYLIITHFKGRNIPKFALRIQSNSGFSSNILNDNTDELEEVLISICNVIENNVSDNYIATFHISNNLDAKNSVINTGFVNGRIDNRVENL